MCRKLFLFGLFGLVPVAHSYYYDPAQVFAAQYQSFFESLELHYEVPAGCAGASESASSTGAGKANCAVADDFNGDGTADYAALLEYIGAGSRLNNRYLDLIVLYSSPATGEQQYQLFTHMGKVTDRGDVDTFLEIQPTGDIDLPSGVKNLERPGINLLSMSSDNGDMLAFPTIYWDARIETFYSITKAND